MLNSYMQILVCWQSLHTPPTTFTGPEEYTENIQMGASVGLRAKPNQPASPGTLGGYVTFKDSKDVYGITNWHVVRDAQEQDRSLAPGYKTLVNSPNISVGLEAFDQGIELFC
jgi:hypothetical protein